jgi:hypothetical protein
MRSEDESSAAAEVAVLEPSITSKTVAATVLEWGLPMLKDQGGGRKKGTNCPRESC